MKSLKIIVAKICLLSLIASLFSSCATIVHGTRQKVAIATNPPGATVTDGSTTMQTPATFNLNRDADYLLTITKPGYESETVKITHVISGAVAGNILAGGFVGWGVDAVSGAQWRLEPESITVNLRPVTAEESIANAKPTESLTTKLEELASLKEKNLLSEEEYKAMKELTLKSVASVDSSNELLN